jgi:hypothetical protein
MTVRNPGDKIFAARGQGAPDAKKFYPPDSSPPVQLENHIFNV